MPLIAYKDINFSAKTLQTIELVNGVVNQYQAQGYDLTLRQVFYQMVARGYIPNKDTEYKKLGSIVNDARLAGLIDWDAITDRTRNLRSLAHWKSPAHIIASAASSFRLDKWATQPYHVEVWEEKDALISVIGLACEPLDVPYFSCRGYTSQSEMWSAAQRLLTHCELGQTPVILHLGDHDPSGKDMTRDIRERLNLFMAEEGYDVEVERLALNMDQIRQYNPPPNPAKITDSRATAYISSFGRSSWELDALDPSVIRDTITAAIKSYIDYDAWDKAVQDEQEHRAGLKKAAQQWETVVQAVR